MKIVSKVPGRIRAKTNKIYRNEEKSQVLDIYLRNLPGIREASVNPIIGTIVVYYDPEVLDLDDLTSRITQVLESDSPYLQYIHENYQHMLAEENKLSQAQEKMIIFGGLYLILKVKHFFFGKFSPGRSLSVLATAALVTVFKNYPVFQRLSEKLEEYFPSNPDKLLLGLGVFFSIIREGDGILFLFLKSFTDAIEANSRLQMKKVLLDNSPNPMDLVWFKEGEEDYLIPYKSLKIGDEVIFTKNDTILVVGEITAGETLVNCLYFTGQPGYRHLQPGDEVREGMVLSTGEITVKITELSERLAKGDLILDDLEIALKTKQLQEKSTYIASGLAVLGYALTGNFITPLAVFLAMNPGAQQVALNAGITNYLKLLLTNKIVLRNVNTLEKILNTSKIVFDKTGTLTDGCLRIAQVESLDQNYTEEEIIQICTEAHVDRYYLVTPITPNEAQRELTPEVRGELGTATRSETTQGATIHAAITGEEPRTGANQAQAGDKLSTKTTYLPADGTTWQGSQDDSLIIGTKEKLTEEGIHVPDDEKDDTSGIILYVVKDQVAIGKIHLIEELDDQVPKAINLLKELGLNDLAIISGDEPRNVAKVANELQIQEYHSHMTKATKASYIEKAKKEVDSIIMVGDGVNDADAMESADVSISYNQANSQVVSSSDCILLEKDLTLIPRLLEITEESYLTIERNIKFSWYYSIAFGALASFGYLNLFQAEGLKTFNLVNSILSSGNISKLDPPALQEVFEPASPENYNHWDEEKGEHFLPNYSNSAANPVTIQ